MVDILCSLRARVPLVIGSLGRRLTLAGIGAVLMPALMVATAMAAPAVTTTTDSSTPGSGSLREAIVNASSGDTIMVPASSGHYTITLGEIPITVPITIKGAGPSSTIIDAGGLSRAFHITSAVSSTATVTFEDLTIENGSTTVAPGGGGIYDESGALVLDGVTMTGNAAKSGTESDYGGGAINTTGGDVTVMNSTLSGNSAAASGAAADDDGGAAILSNGTGTIAITNSTVDSNTTTIGDVTCCGGGAVYQDADAPITISDSHLDDNTLSVTNGTGSDSGGGAVYQDGGSMANTTITDSTLNGNTATITDAAGDDGGGALYGDASEPAVVTLTGSTLNGNTANVDSAGCCSGGGAIISYRAVNSTNSTLDSNTATVTSGRCCAGGGALMISQGMDVDSQLMQTEVAHNVTTVTSTGANAAFDGGGALYDDDDGTPAGFTAIDSDFSDNEANVDNTATSGGGGIITLDSGTDTLTNSTLSGNSTNGIGDTDGGGGLLFGNPLVTGKLSFDTIAGNTASASTGGGIYDEEAKVTTKNSIVALNTAVSGADCGGDAQAMFTSLGYNLEDSPDTCTFTQSTDKVVTASALDLGPLAANGGPTMTRALLAGSPAIDAIPIAACTDQTSPTPVAITTDQRGVARPQPAGGSCDIGAFEFGDADLALTGSAVPAPTTLQVGHSTTLMLAVSNAGPVPATASTVTLALPAGLKLISSSAGQGSCAGATCSLGTLADNASTTATYVVQATTLGTFTATATVATTSSDPDASNNTRGFAITVTAPPPPPAKAPTLAHVSQSHKTWRESKKLPKHATKKEKKTPVGTTFSFTLSENAKVTLTFTPKHKKASGTLTYNDKAGKRKLSFDGKLSNSTKLKPGSYTVTITATASGLASKPAKLSFTIAAG